MFSAKSDSVREVYYCIICEQVSCIISTIHTYVFIRGFAFLNIFIITNKHQHITFFHRHLNTHHIEVIYINLSIALLVVLKELQHSNIQHVCLLQQINEIISCCRRGSDIGNDWQLQ